MGEATVRSFRIEVPQSEVDDLRRRLTSARWPREIDRTRWADGITVDAMHGLVERWRDGFDWRAEEASLNRFPQAVTEIGGQRLHAVHRPSPRAGAQPLVLLHGWPSTVVEFRRVIDGLAEPQDPDL